MPQRERSWRARRIADDKPGVAWRKRPRAERRTRGDFQARPVEQPTVDPAVFKPRSVEQPPQASAEFSLRKIEPSSAFGLPGLDQQGRVAISIEDLRDDTISIFKNSGLSYDEIRAKGGPCPGTMSKWVHRETKRPQLNTIRAALMACGHDFAIVPIKTR